MNIVVFVSKLEEYSQCCICLRTLRYFS